MREKIAEILGWKYSLYNLKKADQILKEISEEIEKGLLTDKEIEYIARRNFPLFELDDEDEKDRKATTKELIQAQLQKSLALLK